MKIWLTYLRRFLVFVIVIALFAVLLLTHSQMRHSLGTNENFGLPEISGRDITEEVSFGELAVFSENGKTMYVSEGGAVRVLDTATNTELWRNTAKEDDVRLLGEEGAANSPIMINYRYDGETDITLYSSSDSVDKEQYSISYSEDGKKLQVSYLFGEVGEGGILPKGISKEFMEKKILPKLSSDESEYLLRRYILYTADTAKSIVLEECPGVKKQPLYYLENCASPAMINKTTAYLKKAGITQELYDEQRKITGEAKIAYDESYSVTVEYWLENGDVMVNIPCNEIKFHPENPLTNIMLNGAATYATSLEEGEYFLPAGSGALQSFKSTNERNNNYVYYGPNDLDYESSKTEAGFPLAVFGVLRKNSGCLMGVIENGAEVATLNERYSYGASQLMLDIALLEYGDSSVTVQQTATVFNSSVYNKDFTVRYRLLGAGTTASEFANEYRALLKKQNKLPETQQNIDTVILEMVGNVSYSYQLAGLLPVTKTLVLTDWEHSLNIYNSFLENGIKPTVKLSGYNKDGLFCQNPAKYSFEKKLGSKKLQEKFLNILDKNNTNVFLDVNLAYCYVGKNQSSGGCNAQNKNARLPNNKIATRIVKSPSAGDKLDKMGVLNITAPSNYLSYAKSYESKLDSRFDISLGDSLSSLNIDYSEKKSYNRSDTMKALRESVKVLSENRSVMVKNPVLPILSSVSVSEDMALVGDNRYSVTEYFPFVQIVLHGHVNYTTDALNAKSDYREELLNAVETGTTVKYTVVGKLNDLVSETEYDYLYYTDWEKWKDTIIEDSKSLKELYEKTASEEMVSYEKSQGLAKTVYSNGIIVYINHTESQVSLGGITVEPNSWTTVENNKF